jgi:ubiquinone/menaquinone biosynthesis C-methylase UbiE
VPRRSERPPRPERTAPLNSSFDDAPDAYDELRAAGHMSRRRADLVAELLRRSPGTVVELGSGTGTLLRELAGRFPDRRFVGVEPLPNYVTFAREQASAAGLGNVAFEEGTGEALGSVVPAGSADVALSIDALHHVRDLDQVLAQLAEVAAPGAHWYAMEPDRLHPYVWAMHVLTEGERTFPSRDFLKRAARAGWRLESRRRLFIYPSGVRRVPPWAERVEQRLEGVPGISGALLMDLVRR